MRAGDPEAATELWWRFHERVRLRLRRRLGRDGAADSAGPEVLGRLLDALEAGDPDPERLGPWIDALVDRYLDERAAGGGRPASNGTGRRRAPR